MSHKLTLKIKVCIAESECILADVYLVICSDEATNVMCVRMGGIPFIEIDPRSQMLPFCSHNKLISLCLPQIRKRSSIPITQTVLMKSVCKLQSVMSSFMKSQSISQQLYMR
jgi:hypothetical protein